MTAKGKCFYGNEISDSVIRNGYVDYRTFSKAFNNIRQNDLIEELEKKGFYFEYENYEEDENGYYPDIFQWYVIDSSGYELCKEAGEIVAYCEELDLALWGITHFGTSWDYVLTNIKIEKKEK